VLPYPLACGSLQPVSTLSSEYAPAVLRSTTWTYQTSGSDRPPERDQVPLCRERKSAASLACLALRPFARGNDEVPACRQESSWTAGQYAHRGHAPLGYDGVKWDTRSQESAARCDPERRQAPESLEAKFAAHLTTLATNGDREHFAARNVLRGLHNGRQAYAVECTLQDRLEVAGITGDPGNGDDHVEYLFEGEVATDLLSALR
jgi:hypothetical protein